MQLKKQFDGIVEIDGLSDYGNSKDMMRGLCYQLRQDYDKILKIDFPMFLFTGVVADRYPGDFSRLIKRAKLGDVVCTNPRVNPNSDNVIRAYLWSVDKIALSKWFKKNRHKDEENNQ